MKVAKQYDRPLVEELVKTTTGKTPSEQYQNIARLYEERTGVKVSWATIKNRVESWGLMEQKEPGGRKKHDLKELYEKTPDRYKHYVKKAENGSTLALIRLNCLECVGYVSKEVRECTQTRCPFWHKRKVK